jgi:hypothetical protein
MSMLFVDKPSVLQNKAHGPRPCNAGAGQDGLSERSAGPQVPGRVLSVRDGDEIEHGAATFVLGGLFVNSFVVRVSRPRAAQRGVFRASRKLAPGAGEPVLQVALFIAGLFVEN